MASSFSARQVFLSHLSSPDPTTSSSLLTPQLASAKALVVASPAAAFRGSLVLKAAQFLTPPTRFDPSKLNVVFHGEEMSKHKQSSCAFPRTYTLTHCDFTANLTLAVSNIINIDQLRRWQKKVQKDDVVAEWKRMKDEASLHVHCYVSGANLLQDIAAEFRYYIFSKELPLVLQALVYGDSLFFEDHPELLDASVWVYFHSSSRKYNRVECWGPLREATQRTLDDRPDLPETLTEERGSKWAAPKTILQALVTFLL